MLIWNEFQVNADIGPTKHIRDLSAKTSNRSLVRSHQYAVVQVNKRKGREDTTKEMGKGKEGQEGRRGQGGSSGSSSSSSARSNPSANLRHTATIASKSLHCNDDCDKGDDSPYPHCASTANKINGNGFIMMGGNSPGSPAAVPNCDKPCFAHRKGLCKHGSHDSAVIAKSKPRGKSMSRSPLWGALNTSGSNGELLRPPLGLTPASQVLPCLVTVPLPVSLVRTTSHLATWTHMKMIRTLATTTTHIASRRRNTNLKTTCHEESPAPARNTNVATTRVRRTKS